MRTIGRRLEKLETVFAPAPASEDMWGNVADLRDDLLRRAEERVEPSFAELREELEHLGPLGSGEE